MDPSYVPLVLEPQSTLLFFYLEIQLHVPSDLLSPLSFSCWSIKRRLNHNDLSDFLCLSHIVGFSIQGLLQEKHVHFGGFRFISRDEETKLLLWCANFIQNCIQNSSWPLWIFQWPPLILRQQAVCIISLFHVHYNLIYMVTFPSNMFHMHFLSLK